MTQPAGLASLNPSTGTVLYGRGQLGSIRLKTSRLSAISILAVLILCSTVSTWMGDHSSVEVDAVAKNTEKAPEKRHGA